MTWLTLATLLPLVWLSVCAASASAAPFAYISNSGDDTVAVIDTATNSVAATVPVGPFPSSIAVDRAGTRVYVSAGATRRTISVIDTRTNTVTNLSVPGGPGLAVSPDGTRLYITGGYVYVIDLTAGTVVAIVPVGQDPARLPTAPTARGSMWAILTTARNAAHAPANFFAGCRFPSSTLQRILSWASSVLDTRSTEACQASQWMGPGACMPRRSPCFRAAV